MPNQPANTTELSIHAACHSFQSPSRVTRCDDVKRKENGGGWDRQTTTFCLELRKRFQFHC